MSLRYLTVAEAHCGEITVENWIKLASQLEMIYPQRGFICSKSLILSSINVIFSSAIILISWHADFEFAFKDSNSDISFRENPNFWADLINLRRFRSFGEYCLYPELFLGGSGISFPVHNNELFQHLFQLFWLIYQWSFFRF